MKLKDIFKMEMYKNRNNKPYLLVIAILTAMASISTFLGIGMIEGKISVETLLIPLIVFTILGLAVFSLLYPFHLLNADYQNKVISLIFASGVSREKYYFVKISATIISCFIAIVAVLIIPAITFLLVYPSFFVEAMQQIFKEFSFMNITSFLLMTIFSWLAYFVTLTTSVIITKGKVAGIFLFIGFSFAVSIIQSMFQVPIIVSSVLENGNINSLFYENIAFSIFQIIVFALIGLAVLRKQDL